MNKRNIVIFILIGFILGILFSASSIIILKKSMPLIKKARKKKGLTREDLGFKIGERTVTISKIENGDLRPSDKMIAKLEKELGISLLEEVKKVTTDHHINTSLTLGDFIRKEK